MYHQKYVDYVELLWEDFTYQIDNKVYKKQENIYYPRFTKVIIHHFLIQDKTLSWRNKIRMPTLKDDYLINTLRFVSRKEASQIYGALLPDCLTIPEMKESKAYKTYLSYATGVVPPKIAKKFNKASSSKKVSVPVQANEEPVQKGKRVKRSAYIHPSGSGTVAEKSLSVEKITPTVTSEGTGDKPGVLDDESIEQENENDEQESKDESSEQENESEEQESDDSKQEDESVDDDQEEEEFVHTPSPTNDKDDENLESESDEVIKSDKEKGLDDIDYQFNDDVDARLKEATQTDK
ncbi:hypothetical protein Tco_0638582 [Tanacetum coccineum]